MDSEHSEMSRQSSFDIRNYEEGITRKPDENNPGRFIYYYIKDNKQVSEKEQTRINKLKIPPAWTNLWVASDENSHIQAVGIDEKGRKQYRYHQEHIEKAELEKFVRLIDFIKAMPKLDSAMKRDKKLDFYCLNRVIVTMLEIVRETHMRVGKEQYARENKSYGISSLKKSHVSIKGDIINFDFKGKSKQQLHYSLFNPEIKSHIEQLLKLEGEKLFQYIKQDTKNILKVNYVDINEYIQKNMGEDFSIKDFRTYAANFHFVRALQNETRKHLPKDKLTIKKNILKALKTTAKYLKHTHTISKKSYVANYAIELYQKNPEYFIERKVQDTDSLVLDILQNYKK